MAYRRRRRFRGAWIPSAYSEGSEDEVDFSTVYPFSVGLAKTGVNNVALTTVAIDNIVDTESLGNLLNDIMQGGYALRRIVGKIFCSYANTSGDYGSTSNTTPFPQGAQVTAGFFIARVQESGDAFPIGTKDDAGNPVAGTVLKQYNPTHPLVNTEPWIWRRTWILGNPLARAARLADLTSNFEPTDVQDGTWNFPPTNALYGSVMDGPHIDARTKRRVLYDERLFFAVAARHYPYNTDFSNFLGNNDQISMVLDLRFFGALRRKKNRSAF